MKPGLLLFVFFNFFFHEDLCSQKTNSSLKFEQGQTISINMKLSSVITQEAMGQAIDFTVDGSVLHSYKVTNATEQNTTLHHTLQQLGFNFDAMGQKRSFDSNNEKDMNGELGKPMKDLLSKSYEMIIDPLGKVLLVKPETMDTTKIDDKLAIVTNMLKDLIDVVQPPGKGKASFFKILPENPADTGYSWTDSSATATGRSVTSYTIGSIGDSTVQVNFTGNSQTVSKAVLMGNETITTMNNKNTGKIIIDKKSGIIREKTTTIESNGSTEVIGGKLPVTSKTTVIITVRTL